jgi:hypothetical protein
MLINWIHFHVDDREFHPERSSLRNWLARTPDFAPIETQWYRGFTHPETKKGAKTSFCQYPS